jgi:hypothetical protein
MSQLAVIGNLEVRPCDLKMLDAVIMIQENR